MAITDHPCQMPLGFDMDRYVQEALVVMRGNPIDAELVFDKPTAAWVKDRLWLPSQQLKHLPGGRLQMRLKIADTRAVILLDEAQALPVEYQMLLVGLKDLRVRIGRKNRPLHRKIPAARIRP